MTTLLNRPVDLAFLDGLHFFEFLLRDFINTEKHCKNNSIVILHDCIPTDAYTAVRESDSPMLTLARRAGEWAGDVWRTVAILQRLRPDLKIHCFDALPTGLVMIINLNSKSNVLSENYFSSVSEYKDIEFSSYGLENYLRSLKIKSTTRILNHSLISNFFWL